MKLAVFSELCNGMISSTKNAAIRCLSNCFLEVFSDGQIFNLFWVLLQFSLYAPLQLKTYGSCLLGLQTGTPAWCDVIYKSTKTVKLTETERLFLWVPNPILFLLLWMANCFKSFIETQDKFEYEAISEVSYMSVPNWTEIARSFQHH